MSIYIYATIVGFNNVLLQVIFLLIFMILDGL